MNLEEQGGPEQSSKSETKSLCKMAWEERADIQHPCSIDAVNQAIHLATWNSSVKDQERVEWELYSKYTEDKPIYLER